MRGRYHRFDALWEEKTVVQRVHSVVGLHGALPLQQDGPGVQSVIGPEHTEAGFLIAMDQRPVAGGENKTLIRVLNNGVTALSDVKASATF